MLLLAGSSAAAQGIRGRVVEAATGQPVSDASVTIHRIADTAVVGAVRSRDDGNFHIDRVKAGDYTVRVRALGFSPIEDTVALAGDTATDLGTIALAELASQLGPQVVTAERQDVTLSPDRNSYSTKNMTTAAGGTAVDVLRNIPSVEVDASNNVTLRGDQNVVVQINGRPTPLKGDALGNFLAQLPASVVKNVEVSTNPSAKNDPDGTAGIINIVLNQNADLGWSGGFTAATGTTGQANVSAHAGHQAGPLTLFGSYGIYRNHQDMDGHSLLTNVGIATPAAISSHIDGSTDPLWQSSTFRTEYKLSSDDAISFDATLAGGQYSRDNISEFANLDQMGDVTGSYAQANDQFTRYLTQDYALGFHRTGDANARTFSTEVRFNETSGTIATSLFGDAITREHDLSAVAWPSLTMQADYTDPFGGSGTKLETGVKEITRRTANDYSAAYLDTTAGIFVPDAARASAFAYDEQIGAAYALLTQQLGKVQAQGGLRAEEAATSVGRYGSLFPSAVLSYGIAKLSYSRRINRPDPSEIDPVEYRIDAHDVYRGNANLRPEYTDALELGLQHTAGWGTIQLNPYFRHTAHAVRFIETVDSTGTTLSTYDNVASTREMGTDVNVTYHAGPLDVLTGGNVSRYQSDAANLPGNPSARASIWSARVNATWKFSRELDAQATTNYRSAYAVEGGTRDAFVFMNLAVRHKLWNDQGSITVRVQDPFNLLRYSSVLANAGTIQSSTQTYGVRGVFIAISRDFGQGVKLAPQDQPAAPAAGPPGG